MKITFLFIFGFWVLLCGRAAWPQAIGLPALGDGDSISLSAERQLGDRIARELYRDPDFLEDAVLDEYIQQLWYLRFGRRWQGANSHRSCKSVLHGAFCWGVTVR